MGKKIRREVSNRLNQIVHSIKDTDVTIESKNKIQYSLDLRKVYAGYGKTTVLHDVTLQVEKGSIIAVIGNSGAGKTTGIRCMTAQIKAQKGSCVTAGYDVNKVPEEVQLRIGYVPQLEYLSLYYDFSALDNALFFGRNFGTPDKIIKKRCIEVMKTLGLTKKEFWTKPVKKLSGGEKKRVSIMIGLINNPEILFLDEPTTGLDPHLRIEVLNFLARINHKFKTTMVIVSHDLECVDYCNQVMVFAQGYMVDFGNPRKLTRSLPNSGKAITMRFHNLTPDEEQSIEKIPEVIYKLHVGRNTFKIFYENEASLSIIFSKLQELGLESNHYHSNCVFLDYFRVMSVYNYNKIVGQRKLEATKEEESK
ncbi:MAG: ATP-binding cassette domain-containing protein [Candidatus Lokiarchaeota archaeon]|nr:ATP-binding cassette domain-containing protein [Candidatus Lokiarchaeota archaeon]